MPTYNVNPNPLNGQGPFGKVPGTIDLPLSRYTQVGNLYGNLPGATNQYFSNVQTQLAGGIPKADQDFMQQLNAESAVAGGMPGTGNMAGTLYGNKSARDLGLLQYQIQNQGAQNYLQGLNALGNLQLSPELQASVAERNAENLAAPNPTEAFNKQLDLYNQGLRLAASSAPWSTTRGSTSNLPQGGTGVYMPSSTGGDRTQANVTVGNYVPNYSNWQTTTPEPQLNQPYVPVTYSQPTFNNDYYNYGNTPLGTTYNPYTNSSTYDPWAGDVYLNDIFSDWTPGDYSFLE